MSRGECPFATPECKYFDGPIGCYIDRHHLYYPKREYSEGVAKAFRNLVENVVDKPRCEHDEEHANNQPPLMPSIEVMKHAVYESRLNRVLEGSQNG